MNKEDLAFHYVCTWEEAKNIVGRYHRFWVSNCGCRENRGGCKRSRIDLCLMFRDDIPGSGGSGRHEISQAEVEEIFLEAKNKHLVTRPYRNEENRAETDGICFCCDDCCEYFTSPDEIKCDKGDFIEETEKDKCTNCGECVEVCYFRARNLEDGELIINHKNCYGCGLCVDVCSEDCVRMVRRNQ
ncbi:MAG: 4Fe-4S binding protein [Candidatus Zixiibacteriota bacterium]